MNSKSFRRNGAKPKTASSTFISLHFNKADEDQLEISYKDDKKIKDDGMSKSATETSQSNLTLYIPTTKESANHSSEIFKEACDKESDTVLASDSITKTHITERSSINTNSSYGETLEDSVKYEFSKTKEKPKNTADSKLEKNNLTSIKHIPKDQADSEVTETDNSNFISSDSQLKLSPAIEAAEVDDNYVFNHYVNDELEKAKCEILGVKKEMSTSFSSSSLSQKDLKNVISSLHLQDDIKTVKMPDASSGCDITKKKSANEKSHSHVVQQIIDIQSYAKNSVKFHILIALLACICAPIPSWLSGFLVGIMLSGSLVYWLYKPQKNKKTFYNLSNLVSPSAIKRAKFQEDSGILKGWMNELPSFMSYSPEKYHVSCTRSVYVRLDGSYLRLSFSQKNISKRAMFNEPRHDMQFIYQQHYDIADATIELLPKGLINKRLWSKKYPICLRISNSKEAVLSNPSRMECLDGPFSTKTNKKENLNKKFMPRLNENNEIVIYLFSRTDRDKNLWFNRFQKASKIKLLRPHSPTLSTRFIDSDFLENKRTMSLDFTSLQFNSSAQNEEYFSKNDDESDDFVEITFSKQHKFEMYMSALLSPLNVEHPFAASCTKKEKKEPSEQKGVKNQSTLTWLNVLIGRLFFDFLIEDTWSQLVTEKIQKKLNRIKLPFFLTELTVKDINLGSALPKIHHASDPSVDERGLWVDIDLSYNGSFHMTLETKLNLRRFKADSEEFWNSLSEVSKQSEMLQQNKQTVYNSEEDSMESSSDDESPFPDMNEDSSIKDGSFTTTSSGSKSKKFLKFVDRLAQSPYFQHAAKNKYIKKAMDDISNTPLVLTVEVQWLTGTLAINIPPWPTDRLWYGFRTNPSLSITARPKLGQHVVTFTQATEWIEKKLVSEFQKVLVMPNMDDLIIPIMQSGQNTPNL